jgi:hypothetical protein
MISVAELLRLLSAKVSNLIRDPYFLYTRILVSSVAGFSAGLKLFSSFKCIQTGSELAHPPIQWITVSHSPWLKKLERQINHLPSRVPRARMTQVTLLLELLPSLSA